MGFNSGFKGLSATLRKGKYKYFYLCLFSKTRSTLQLYVYYYA